MCGIKAMLYVDRIGIYKLYKQRALDRGCHLDLRFYRLDNQLLNSSFGGGGGGGGSFTNTCLWGEQMRMHCTDRIFHARRISPG